MMNNKGTSFLQYFVFLIVLAVAAFFFLPDTVPFPMGGAMDKMGLTQIEKDLLTQGEKEFKSSDNASLDDHFTIIKELQIPQTVYDSIPTNPSFQEYLSGDKKQVLFFNIRGVPTAQYFSDAIEQAFASSDIQAVYQKNVIPFSAADVNFTCNPPHTTCPEAWLVQNCSTKICIINPQTRRVIAADVFKGYLVKPLLEKYKNW